MQAAVKQEGHKQKFLNPNRFKIASVGQGRIEYIATPEAGTTLEEVLDPAYWGLVASDVSRAQGMPHIEIIPDDLAYHADLLVVGASATLVKTKVIHHVQWEVETMDVEPDTKGYTVAFKGSILKFCVIDGQGNVVAGSEGKSKLEAQAFLKEHLKVLGM